MTDESDDGFIRTIQRMDERSHAWRDFNAGNDRRGPGIPYAYANNPAPGQFDGRRVSQGRVCGYKPFVVVDGEGVRCSVYFSGCLFHCRNCFSPLTWRFDAGFEYTDEFEDQVIADLSQPYVQGLTLLGGEPMANTPTAIRLCERFRKEFGHDKDIWCWTGFTWEELHRDGETPDKLELLSYVDVLVDGRFMDTLKNPFLQFRGSSNQRLIDVPASTDDNIHVWDRVADDKPFHEFSTTDRASADGRG